MDEGWCRIQVPRFSWGRREACDATVQHCDPGGGGLPWEFF